MPFSRDCFLVLIGLLLISQALAQQAHTWAIAHRGFSAYYPENTLTAFREAEKIGAEGFEMDLRITADGVVILMHDSTLDRTTNCSGSVSSQAYYGNIQYCVAGGIERVPTLQDLLNYLTSTSMNAYFDIKAGDQCIKEIATALNSYHVDFSSRVYLGAQNGAEVELLAQVAPRFIRSIVVSIRPVNPSFYDVDNYNMNFGAVTSEFVQDANRLNITLFAWTVNNPDDMKQAIDMQVSGVVTDYPDVFLSIRNGKTHY